MIMENKWISVAVLVIACMMIGVEETVINISNSTAGNNSILSNNITSNLTMMGSLNMTNNLTQIRPNNMTNNLTHMGPLNMTSNLTQMGPLNMTNNLTQMRPNNMTNNLTQMGPHNMTNNLTLMRPNNMTNNITQMGPHNVTSNLTQIGPLNMTNNLTQMGPHNTSTNNIFYQSTDTINRDNCRRDRACFSTPPTCNPAAQGSCFFISTRRVNGNADLTFEISGESEGYIAVALSCGNSRGEGATFYSCANINRTVKFIKATLNSTKLCQDNTFSPGSINGSVNGSKIQCKFTAPDPCRTRATNTGTYLFLFTGQLTNGTLGSPVSRLATNGTVDLSNPNSTDVAVIPNTNALSEISATASNTAVSNGITALNIVTKENCKKDRACFSNPASCDPSNSNSCLFVSTRAVNRSAENLTFELSGQSDGYIAVGLSRDNKQDDGDIIYACANNNGTIKFIQAMLNNSKLTQNNAFSPGSLLGSVTGKKIQCIFEAPGISNSTTNTLVFLFLFKGILKDGILETPDCILFTNTANDLTDPTSQSTVVTLNSKAAKHTASQAALITLTGAIVVLLL